MLSTVDKLPLRLSLLPMVRLVYHFDSLLLTLHRSCAHVVAFKPLLRHFLCLRILLFQRLSQSYGLFEIVQRRIDINRGIVDSLQLRFTIVLNCLVIDTRVLPCLLSIGHGLFLMNYLRPSKRRLNNLTALLVGRILFQLRRWFCINFLRLMLLVVVICYGYLLIRELVRGINFVLLTPLVFLLLLFLGQLRTVLNNSARSWYLLVCHIVVLINDVDIMNTLAHFLKLISVSSLLISNFVDVIQISSWSSRNRVMSFDLF